MLRTEYTQVRFGILFVYLVPTSSNLFVIASPLFEIFSFQIALARKKKHNTHIYVQCILMGSRVK